MTGHAKPGFVSSFTSHAWFRAAGVWLFLAVLISMVFVEHPKAGWGVRSRLALVFAVVDEGRFTIDSYHAVHPTTTGDKAFYDGHFYSDKLIGVSLLALPVYAGIRAVGLEPSYDVTKYVLRVVAVALPAALSVVVLWALLVRAGAEPRRALLAVALSFWGSIWFGFSTSFFPYSLGIACCLLALWLILYPWPGRVTPRVGFVTGFLCGYAILCDLIFGLLVMALVTVFLLRVASEAGLARAGGPWPRSADSARAANETLVKLAAGAAGGLLPLSIFTAYTVSIFGRPAHPLEYLYVKGFGLEAEDFMGLTVPELGPLWFLTVHPFRGLFFWSPVLALAVAGLVRGVRAGGVRRLHSWLGLWALGSYLTFNAGFQMWWGGDAMGPRLLLPVMAAVPLGLGECCRRSRSRAVWIALLVLGGLSVLASVPLSLSGPETPPGTSYAVLHAATPSISLVVPQFEERRGFFTPSRYWDPRAGFRVARILSLAYATILPALLVEVALRRLASAAETPDPGEV
jgi:hypothetical protein